VAVIAVSQDLAGRIQGEVVIYTWSNMSAGDTGGPVSLEYMSERSVQVLGDFAGSGTVQFKGTLERTSPSNWVTLTNPGGTPLVFQALGLETVLQVAAQVRPEAVGGSGLRTVKLYLKKTIR
jgi:hypothetical protein